MVWKLYRFGRSLRELIDLVNGLREQGVEFVSLRESIDTTSPGGKLVFHVFGTVAEFERDLILERTMAGLEAARARGRKGGRKPAMDEWKIALVSKLMRGRETPISEVCGAVGVSKATLYRYLKPRRHAEVTGEERSAGVTWFRRLSEVPGVSYAGRRPLPPACGTGVRRVRSSWNSG